MPDARGRGAGPADRRVVGGRAVRGCRRPSGSAECFRAELGADAADGVGDRVRRDLRGPADRRRRLGAARDPPRPARGGRDQPARDGSAQVPGRCSARPPRPCCPASGPVAAASPRRSSWSCAGSTTRHPPGRDGRHLDLPGQPAPAATSPLYDAVNQSRNVAGALRRAAVCRPPCTVRPAEPFNAVFALASRTRKTWILQPVDKTVTTPTDLAGARPLHSLTVRLRLGPGGRAAPAVRVDAGAADVPRYRTRSSTC